MAWRTIEPQLGRVARFAAGALTAVSAFTFAGAPAEAHHYRHYRHYAHYGHVAHYAAPHARRFAGGVLASPAFSAIIVDANTDRTLWSVAEDAPRHPASITKVMTLYLLFEQLDKGAMTLQTRLPISEHAAAQEPSKLGIEAGATISVEDAIKAVVTRSANDVAVAIAEAIGRDEDTFAEMMTGKAHALGMASTVYRNASGLPNDEQITTARDLTVLARSLEERFPRYFKYFSTHEFDYDGEIIGNHNHLLGRVDGVDGIKTGYTRASGFNLLTSVHRDGRSLVAVVMGGRTAGARDRIMENLIEDHIVEASTAHTATTVADASRDEQPQRAAAQELISPHPAALAANVPSRVPSARMAEPPLAEGDDAEEDQATTLRVAAVKPPAKAQRAEQPAPPRTAVAAAPSTRAQSPAELGWVKGPDPVSTAQKMAQASVEAPIPPGKPKPAVGVAPAETTIAARTSAEPDDQDAGAHRGWVIQIGATDDAAKASALLARARERDPKAVAAAKPITQKVQKGEDTFYRARFAGLDPASAESACRSLKRNGFSCFAAPD
jgi:D-alanyl-D-alanine carboxypeptidase